MLMGITPFTLFTALEACRRSTENCELRADLGSQGAFLLLLWLLHLLRLADLSKMPKPKARLLFLLNPK